MTNTGPDEQAIFHATRRMAEPEARRLYLDQACGDDRELRAHVEALLKVHDDDRSFLESRVEKVRASIPDPTSDGPGTIIGPYRLIEQLGEGGMGTVYLAEQTEPVRRQVALKIVRSGMDSRQVIARFDVERQALALMDHPNIARIIDAGESPPVATGGLSRPYFVMELVQGLPITKFCDDHHLTPKQRLELFIPVCQAIQHAHQKGIIHRDLKPTNVLVTQVDGRPIPKVIDFGVAKATGSRLADQTFSTGLGAVVGTLEYMSPEQAGPTPHDIDTRSDIYSLGVLLYELLTGTPPFEKKRFREAALQEMLRMVCEEEPPKPSTRISTAAGLPSIAANRGIEPKQLASLLRSDLDWIVMRCLEKDRGRRYATANGLARDIERYLSDEPLEAGPPSAGYKIKKFLRRNRGPVIAATLLLISLIGGVVGTSIGMVRANRARDAEAERAEGERQAKESAEKRLSQIEKGIDVLNSVFENLDPRTEEKEGRPLRALLGDRLVKAAEQLEGDAIGDPVAVARLQNRLGKSLSNLGLDNLAIPLYIKARATLTSALGKDHPDTLNCMNDLATGYRTDGKFEQAISLHQETLALRQSRLGPDHPDTLTSMNNLAAAYRFAGKIGEALPLQGKVLALRREKLGRDHVDTMASMNNLAMAYHVAGKLDRAVPLYEETLALRKAKLGEQHRSTLTSMINLALGYYAIGKNEQSLRLGEAALGLCEANLGHEHPETLTCMNNLSLNYQICGRLDQAEKMCEEVFRIRKKKQSGDHPDTLIALNNLALCLDLAGKPDQALPLFEEVLKLRKAKLGPNHPDVAQSMCSLATILANLGKVDQALPLCEEGVKLSRTLRGSDHPETLYRISMLASIYCDAKSIDAAWGLVQEVLAGIEQREFRLEYVDRIVIRSLNDLERMQKFETAEALSRKWLVAVKKKDGPDSASYGVALRGLGNTLLRQNKPIDAEPILHESLTLLQKYQPEAWTTFLAESLLGAALFGQKKYADAEPLLLHGHAGLARFKPKTVQYKGANGPTPAILTETVERLIQLYNAWGKPAEAEKWRKQLPPAKP